MPCLWCGKDPLEQRGHTPRLFCNASCRNKVWQKKRAEKLRQEGPLRGAQDERDRQLRGLLQEALEVLAEGEKSP